MEHLLRNKNFKGQVLVELLVAMGIAALFLPALITGLVTSREGRVQQNLRQEAIFLAREAEEAVRVVRETGWNTFAINGTYHPEVSGSSWILSPGSEAIGDFTREILIEDAYRDSQGALAESGTPDPSTKKVTVSVLWSALFPSKVENVIYLTRHLENATYLQTTASEFNLGTKTNVTVTNNFGGEVVLAAGGNADWCEPDLSIASLDLPKQGVANALTAIEGQAFAGTGENASGVSFANVSITNANPPAASIDGTIDGYKTNDVFGEEGYVYVATDTNSKEIAIISLTATPYGEVGYFDATGPTDAESVYVVGNTGYMVQGDKFRNFDVSTKTGSRPAIDADGVTLAGIGESIVVVGNYAYIAISGSGTEMQIVDLASPTNLSIVGNVNVDGQSAADIFVNSVGTRAYLATGASATQKELFIVDVTSKINPSVVGSYDTNGMSPKGITVVPGGRAIIVGTGAEEYQAVNISTETAPVRCGGININTGVNGVASVLEADGDAFSYIITGDASSEFKIIEGGPGGTYSLAGTFESSTFDASASVAFNRFEVKADTPGQSAITYQVAASDAVSGSCSAAAFSFIGPDGTDGTFFATSSAIPVQDDGSGYENPSQCFRLKAFLATDDPSFSPVFHEFRVNYSP